MAKINDESEKALWKYIKKIRDMNTSGWNPLQNCAWFASEAWQVGTGEYIDPSNGKTVGDIVAEEHMKGLMKKLGIPEFLIDKLLPGFKKMPFNTPLNLSDAIKAVNGGQTDGHIHTTDDEKKCPACIGN